MKTKQYIAFLRGINVSGHHKVPMGELQMKLQEWGFEHVVTLLNSGNVIFTTTSNPEDLEKTISEYLEHTFGFPVPTIVRDSEMINRLFQEAPFQGIEVHKDIRLYVSFLKKSAAVNLKIPWASSDNAYKILAIHDKTILSVLDLSVSNTPKAMEGLEKYFGRDITTRNWNTIARIVKKL